MSQPGLFDDEYAIPSRFGPATIRVSDTTHILTPGKGSTADYDFTLNPYRGCTFGCSYCYATFFVADDALRETWGRWVEVKARAADALRRRDLGGKTIFMSSVTDPYQPVEREIGLTRRVVEVLLEQQARLVVQTRSPVVTRDVDLFRRFRHLRVNVSITTDTDAVRKRYEPGCASIRRRLEAVAALKAAGLKVSVCVCPMLPMEDPAGFGRMLTEMGVDYVAASYFHTADRLFAAGTRDRAWELAQREGWDSARFAECREALRSTCRPYARGGVAFGPV